MTTTLKFYKKPIKVKITKEEFNFLIEMNKLEKEFPEIFNQKTHFYNWVDSIETAIKEKGEKNVIRSF